MSDALDLKLDAISKRTQEKTWSLLPDEITCLIQSFLPDNPLPMRSKAYIALSAVCQRLRNYSEVPPGQKQIDSAISSLYRAFAPSVVSSLAETVEAEALKGLTFLSALFEVDWQAAASIFQDEVTLQSIEDALDLFQSSSQIARAVAHLFAQANGHKSCRVLITPSHSQWLTVQSRQTRDDSLRAAAAVALVKLSRGSGADTAEAGGSLPQADDSGETELAQLMKGMVVDAKDSSSIADAVEGLAYMSTDPLVGEMLSTDTSFLSRLFAIIPHRNGPGNDYAANLGQSPIFGVVVIISNICAYRPRLSEEEAQIMKLRQMAKSPSGSSAPPVPTNDSLVDDDRVRIRGRRLIKAGVLDALTMAVRATESRSVRLAAAKALLSLIEDKENRGRVLQVGGAKTLMLVIQGSFPSAGSASSKASLPQLETSDIEPIQALAKLTITASPIQVFGPNAGALYDAIRPLSLMLVHPSSNLLQRFEALMALTNLSSSTPEAASRIARAEGLMNKVELLMLEDHALVRRAATELVCNLIAGCEEVYDKYGGENSSASRSKLQVLIALCDVEDLPTRLAASGALATLTTSPNACRALLDLQRERQRVLPIIGQLVDPSVAIPGTDAEDETEDIDFPGQSDPGLVHRGVVSLRNIFVTVKTTAARNELAAEADHIGLVKALVGVIKSSSGDSPALRPTAEALKWVIESGIEVTV